MIARIWRGWTTPADADAYERLVKTEVFPAIADRAGYRRAHLLRRPDGDEVAFVTLLWFDDMAAIERLVGDDVERAHVPPEARALLTRFDERVLHFEVRSGDDGVATVAG